MNETTIEWTDVTWNPASGCERITEGCRYCYAHTLAENKRGTAAFPDGFDLTIRRHKLAEPARLRQPSMVFVNSMSDLFWDQIPDGYRHEIVDVMEAHPRHQFQVLTKRPELAVTFWRTRKVPSNVWCGATIESNRHVGRADALRQIDAEVRFISAEPLLDGLPDLDTSGIHWLISGGESGLHLSDPHVCARRGLVERLKDGTWSVRDDRADWVRGLRDKCAVTRTAFLHKQWGGLRPKSGGRMLDGRTHDGYPRTLVDGAWMTAPKYLV